MDAVKKLLDIALAEVGYLEKATNANLDSKTDNAGYNNYTKYARDLDALGDFYNGKKQGYAYCDVFADWCFWKAFGETLAQQMLGQPKKSYGAGCNYSANYYKSMGRFYKKPKPGDQIFFCSGSSITHTGIVYKVDSANVYTVEGNTSGASGVIANGGGVMTKSYALNYSKIYGYGRPKYELVDSSYKKDQYEGSGNMAIKIYLSPSDQYANTYAYGNTNEGVQTQKISSYCETALKRCGFEVKSNPIMNTAIAESNSWGADLHVPIHTNGSVGHNVSGTRMFAWNLTGEGYQAAKAIFDVLAPLTPGKSENIKANQTLTEMKKTNAPCVYIEVEFHDVASTAKWIIENVEEIGETICKGICKHFGKTYVAPTPKPAPVAVQYVTVSVPKLAKGSTGASVEALQVLLASKGEKYEKLLGSAGCDGDFGTGTKNAVTQYQRDTSLAADGVAGKDTWTKLLTT